MYFYNLEGTMIIKYKVDLNVTKLKKLKQEMINNCSQITNKTYETIETLLFDSQYVKNYKRENTNKKDFDTNKDIFLVSYDLYNPPYLVILIDQLLLGNTIVINKIKKYNEIYCVDNSFIQEQYQNLLSSIYGEEDIKIYGEHPDETKKERKKQLLKEMEKLLNMYETQNKNNDLIEGYRLQVLECINLNVIKTISLNMLFDIQDFFNDYTEQTINKDLYKILQKK